VRADRKKLDYAAKVCDAVRAIEGAKVANIVDFCCFKPAECQQVFTDLIEPLSREGRLNASLRYVFVSTDSTYEASAILIDGFAHKFVSPAKQKEGLPKFPKSDKLAMYRQTYSKYYATGGVKEECGYLHLQNLTSPATEEENEKVREFLKDLDSYGRKKLETEERFENLASKFNAENATKLGVFSLRLPDVIGPFDDSYRLQKLALWMKMVMDGKPCNRLGYEERDLHQPLSFVLSTDVASVIVRLIKGEVKAEPGAFNLACSEQLILPELLTLMLQLVQS